jgi:hypothetical protein
MASTIYPSLTGCRMSAHLIDCDLEAAAGTLLTRRSVGYVARSGRDRSYIRSDWQLNQMVLYAVNTEPQSWSLNWSCRCGKTRMLVGRFRVASLCRCDVVGSAPQWACPRIPLRPPNKSLYINTASTFPSISHQYHILCTPQSV